MKCVSDDADSYNRVIMKIDNVASVVLLTSFVEESFNLFHVKFPGCS